MIGYGPKLQPQPGYISDAKFLFKLVQILAAKPQNLKYCAYTLFCAARIDG